MNDHPADLIDRPGTGPESEAEIAAAFVRFGRPATLALGEQIRLAKGSDPLLPVTVVVPSNAAGLTARRTLASPRLTPDGDGGGLINVEFATPFQLAARLGAPVLAGSGRRPISDPVLGAAIRQQLAFDPGPFDGVHLHPATEAALARSYKELTRVRPEALEALAASDSARTRGLVATVRAVRERLSGYYDENDLALAAAQALTAGRSDAAGLGAVVLHLVDDLSPALSEMFIRLSHEVSMSALVALAGDDEADAPAKTIVNRLALHPQPASAPAPTPIRVIVAPDPDEEVRAAVRALLEHAAAGVPFDRMAVVYPSADPYLRVLREQLDDAGMQHNGAGGRPLADTMVGRVLLRLLDLLSASEEPERRFRRQDVIDLVSAGPLRSADGAAASATAWDELTRRAGVVGGIEDWRLKLERYRADQLARVDQAEVEGWSAGRTAQARRNADVADRVLAFVTDLHGRVDTDATSWRERVDWTKTLLHDLLPPLNKRNRWPDVERDAADAVDAALERLSVLDDLDPAPSATTFERAVSAELDRPAGRRGRFGVGVMLAPLQAMPGLDLDVVIVVGVAEGRLPLVGRDDSLLPEEERRGMPGADLPSRADRLAVDKRAFLATRANAGLECVLIHARGDHRTGRELTPSRWLLELLGDERGEPGPVAAGDWPIDDVRVTTVDSFQSGLLPEVTYPSLIERDMASLLAYRTSSLEPAEHFLVEQYEPGLARGFEVLRARTSDRFTEFDGNLAATPPPSPAEQGVLSASRLETWAKCPMRYFLGNVLGLGEIERPEEIVEISRLDLGSMVHEILERFLSPVVAAEPAERIQPGETWSSAERDRLLSLAEVVFGEYEERGITGKALLWRVRKEGVLAELERWLASDAEVRRSFGSVPEAVEMRIGFEGEDPVWVDIADGRTLAFRGFADRVDVDAQGSPVVLDYKTGKFAKWKPDEDPVDRGTRLQLGLYAEAARQRLGSETAAAYYWFTASARAPGQEILGYRYGPDQQERFVAVLGQIVEGIETGVFPTNSGEYNLFFGRHENCSYCEFDHLCPRDRERQSEHKQDDPGVQTYVTLSRGPVDDAAEGR